MNLSAHSVATLLVRLNAAKLTPVAEAASRFERPIKSLFIRAAHEARDAVPVTELEGSLVFGGTGAPLYILEDALKAWEKALLGDGVEAAPTDWIKMRAAAAFRATANKKDLPSVLNKALTAGANATEVCVPITVVT